MKNALAVMAGAFFMLPADRRPGTRPEGSGRSRVELYSGKCERVPLHL